MKYIEWPAHRSLDWEPKDEEEYTKLCSGNSFAAGVLYCMDKLEEQAKEAETKGEWKWDLADNGWADHTCSVCGYTKNTDIHVRLDWKYCPYCGSRMKEER